ncbi:MAG: HDOD domain-containing protein [bacterium]
MSFFQRLTTTQPTGEEVKQFFLHQGELPTFPAVALEFMELANDPYASVMSMASIVERDPALAAKTLKLSNSAYIGYARQVSTIREAIVLLGLREMRALVLTISVFRAFGQLQKALPPAWEQFWLHSLAIAQTARRLAKQLRIKEAEQAYLAGLLHDIGKLLYYLYDSDRYTAALDLQIHTGESLLEIEKKTFGNTHPELGCWLLELWNFPQPLSEAVLWHETPELAPRGSSLVGLTALAELIVKAQGIGIGEALPVDPAVLESSNAWQLVADSYPSLRRLDMGGFVSELASLNEQVASALKDMRLV